MTLRYIDSIRKYRKSRERGGRGVETTIRQGRNGILFLDLRTTTMSFLLPGDRSLWKTIGAALLFTCLGLGFAGRGKAAARPTEATPISPRFAIADFDGDSQPDLATVQLGQVTASHARYWIRFEMSAGARQFIGVTAPVGGLEIAPRDVNGDNSLDLIVTTPWLNRPVAVLLNDGHGNFTLRDPEAFSTAVWRFETSLCPASVEVRDLAAVFTRVPGDCSPQERTLRAAELLEQLIFEPSHGLNSSPAVSVFGRAPPISVLHV
jgi:hypothetical protein